MKYEVRFFLKEPTATKPTPINLHFNYTGERLKLGTGLLIDPKQWNPEKERAKRGTRNETVINDQLAELESTIMKLFIEIKNKSGSIPTAEAIRKRFRVQGGARATGKPVDFFEAYERFIEESKAKRQPATIRIYTTIRNHVQNFGKAYGIKLTFEKIDTIFFEKFTGYLVNMKQIKSNNTLWNIFKNLRVFMKWAEEQGLTNGTDYRKLKVSKYDPPVIALSHEELSALQTVDLSTTPGLDNVRHCFLLQCYTGLRFSDLLQLRSEHLHGDTIRLTTTKTREPLTIPLLPEAKAILEGLNFQLRVISNQKMNDALKVIGQKAELTGDVETIRYCGVERVNETVPKWELLSTHVGRKTFVTLALEKGVRAEVVMKITGHKDLRSFQRYVGVTNAIAVKELTEAWG